MAAGERLRKVRDEHVLQHCRRTWRVERDGEAGYDFRGQMRKEVVVQEAQDRCERLETLGRVRCRGKRQNVRLRSTLRKSHRR